MQAMRREIHDLLRNEWNTFNTALTEKIVGEQFGANFVVLPCVVMLDNIAKITVDNIEYFVYYVLNEGWKLRAQDINWHRPPALLNNPLNPTIEDLHNAMADAARDINASRIFRALNYLGSATRYDKE